MVTVIMTCWKRFRNVDEIIDVFLNEPEVDEIIVWDNSGEWLTDKPVTTITSSTNYGANVRFAVATIAKNDAILYCDDDIMPHAGIVSDLLSAYNDSTAVGIYGRTFDGSYKDGGHIYAEEIERPVGVEHIVGYMMLLPRWTLLGHDYSRFPWFCGEVELFGRLLNNSLSKVIVPTCKFTNLDEMEDEHALSLHSDAPAQYEETWSRYFKE